jgi:hypothetical protein
MSANRCQTHHDPIPSFRAREAESSDRSGRVWSRPTLFGSARRAVQRANPGCTGRLATQFARRAPPDRGSRRLNGSFANGLGPFNAHRLGAGGNGLVQYVFRSPARIQTVRSSPRGPCAAPPNEKRSSLCYTINYGLAAAGNEAEPHGARRADSPHLHHRLGRWL